MARHQSLIIIIIALGLINLPFARAASFTKGREAKPFTADLNPGDSLGSIEYAVEHLGTRLIVVLGHERCGAVTAALGGGSAPGHINSLVRDIQPAVAASKGKEGDPLTNAIHENDAEVATKIRKQAELGQLASQVRVVEGYYNLDTGRVEWSAR